MKRILRIGTICLSLCALTALVTACGNDAGGTATVNTATDTSGSIDAGATGSDTATAADAGKPPAGNECKSDTDCTSGICHSGACSKSCASASECDAGQNCSLDAKSRLICNKPQYAAGIGVLCGHDGKCAETLKCVGRQYSAEAFCTATCATDLDCPGNFQCADVPSTGKVCIERQFCGQCQFDAQCGEGNSCTKMSNGSFCTRACNMGGTDCPRYSTCKMVEGNKVPQCVHNAGTCKGEGKQCDPCNTLISGECGSAGRCLQYNHTKEAFCGLPCTDTCDTGMKCVQVSQDGAKACVPDDAKSPKCVDKLGTMYEIGAKMHDYAMVGMVDTDGDGNLHTELPRIIHFSDYAEHTKLLIVNVTAVWCSACQQETKDIAKMLNAYSEADVAFFQILFDGAKPGQLMNMPLLKDWQKQLKPVGAVGMDPSRVTVPWNSKGSTPLNMIINAKTREVLYKVNGYSKPGMIAALNKFLKQ